MCSRLPDDVVYVRILKGAPLSVITVLTKVDCSLNLHQLSVLTGYPPDEIIPALEMLSGRHLVEKDSVNNGWTLSRLYALMLLEHERKVRRN